MKKYSKKQKGLIAGGVALLLIIALLIWAIAFPNPLGPSVRRITTGIKVLVILSAVLIVVLLIYRARKNKRLLKISTFFLALFMAFIVFVNVIVSDFHVLINQFLDRNTITAEDIPTITKKAQDLTSLIESEGVVLLENKNDVLPLQNKKVNLFGYASTSIAYGGAGSGAADESKNISLPSALKEAGFEVNEELIQFYKSKSETGEKKSVLEMLGSDYNIKEPALNEYEASLLEKSKEFSDTAVMVVGRSGGEGADMPMDMSNFTGGDENSHYMQLSQNEIELLDMLKTSFSKVVVLVNSSSPMELGFLKEEGVDGALWIGGPGSTGLRGVAQVLSGDVNPSGRTPDTYAYDATSSPAYMNAGNFTYLGSDHDPSGLAGLFSKDKQQYHFVNYQEGIYVGYRYYETAAADGFIDYDTTVQYPFGYGLSYTQFEQEMGDLKVSDGTISVDVKVTNTGAKPGKEVAQLYYTPPYTKGGIEKSHVVLAAFGKTKVLEPNESETLTLTFAIDDMASYDYMNEKSYVLEAGTYEIKLMKNSHEEVDQRSFEVSETKKGRESDLTLAVNQFEDVDRKFSYVSRSDWEGTVPKKRGEDIEITEELMKEIEDTSVVPDSNASGIKVKKHGISLKEMKGLDYKDPKWDEFLEQLSVKDMMYLIGTGGWQTVALPSIGKPAMSDIDGPAGLNGLINGTTGNQYTSEIVVASTWNTDLAFEFGKTLGEEAYAKGVSGIYGPAMNIHRTPFSGRNFEYYSEDGLLSGKMGAAMVRGGNETNTYMYVKHFALNDQESNAIELVTWSNEQAIRELYLRPFEITVKEGKTKGMMASFNRIGTKWTAASPALMTKVLRNEWGFEGLVITDNAMMGRSADADQAIAAGTDLLLSSTTKEFDTANSPTGQQNLRKASHNTLFVFANSNGFDLARVGIPAWIFVMVGVDIILLGLAALWAMGNTKKKKIKNKVKKEGMDQTTGDK